MLGLLKKLFGAKTPEVKEEAPYKVETPVELPKASTTSEKASDAMVSSIAPSLKKQGGNKKQSGNKKPAAPKKQGGSKPRKPKAPKAPKA